MHRTGNNPAAIVSKRVIPSHQIASIMQQHGWTAEIIDRRVHPDEIRTIDPKMLIVDIDDSSCNGIGILQWFRSANPLNYTIALCQGGCSPAMRSARQLGVDGFFYLNASGLSLDPGRGLLPVFLQSRQSAPGTTHKPGQTVLPYITATPNRPGTSCPVRY
ncbi:MAG TPA: hypothetical protein VNI58_05100 [Mariprofundaceae bacterium]|nr:hypothetical protein [Mariprofundaceae bacterium]